MARPSHSRALSIWANGERVGLWLMPATGAMELRYDASWQTSPTGRPLSLSLPFGVGDTPLKGEQVANYFDNLLPDSQDIRRRIATRFRTNTMQTFDLLQAVGRDCVGAVQLLGENDAPTNIEKIEGTPLSESDIERWLRETTSSSIGADDEEDDFRISLAGAQEKTALGVAPHHKYEAHGGPGVREIANVLRQSEAAHQDIETFLSAQIVYWMLAAPDGHAKNFSIRLLAGGRFHLTPLYDVMSIWPVEGNADNQWSWYKATLAMAIWGKNRHYRMRDIKRKHFNSTARLCHYGSDAEPIIARIVERTPDVIDQVSRALPDGFPHRVAALLFDGLRRAATSLEAMPTD